MKRGFTLIELLVVLAIGGLVCGTLIRALTRQQRFYSAATSMLDVRGQLRDGASVLVADIRGAAVARYGFPTMTDSALELYATLGSSAVCTISGGTLFLVPSRLQSGAVVTSFLASPDTGDIALVYAHSPAALDSSRWYEARVATLTSRAVSTACPASTGFTSSSDAAAGRTTFALTLAGGIPSGVRRGAPVRFLRRGRYSLYRSGDGSSQLGYRRCAASPPHDCSAIQPVSGPYRPYSPGPSPSASGLAFRYYDSAGRELFDAALSPLVARVDVVLRGETPALVSMTGDARSRYSDSAIVTISPRNRGRL
jgi:prepilin-type N-terminal cleavage/methylation domain-containing protein